MKFVIDASVAIKWFIPEQSHDAAGWLIAHSTGLVAPDLIIVEVANVACKKAKVGEITIEQARSIVSTLHHYIPAIHPSLDLAARATEFALALKHPVYDCMYLACAERTEAPLVTADRNFLRRVKRSRWSHIITELNDDISRRPEEGITTLPGLVITLTKIYAVIRAAALLTLTDQTLALGLKLPDWNDAAGRPSSQFIQMHLQSSSRRILLRQIEQLSLEERIDLVALVLIGRGDESDWTKARRRATDLAVEGAEGDIEHLVARISLADDLRTGVESFRSSVREGSHPKSDL